jgi:hypothetical protein
MCRCRFPSVASGIDTFFNPVVSSDDAPETCSGTTPEAKPLGSVNCEERLNHKRRDYEVRLMRVG